MSSLWFVIALVVGVILAVLVAWLRNRSIEVKWYEWLIVVVGLGMLVFGAQVFLTSFSELEVKAGWVHILLFGAPALILFALVGLLARRRHSAAG